MHDESLHAQVPYAPPKATAKPEPLPANSPLSSGGSVVLQASLSWVRGSEAGSQKRCAQLKTVSSEDGKLPNIDLDLILKTP